MSGGDLPRLRPLPPRWTSDGQSYIREPYIVTPVPDGRIVIHHATVEQLSAEVSAAADLLALLKWIAQRAQAGVAGDVLMTPAQHDYLRCVAIYGELGPTAVSLQFAVLRGISPRLEASTCKRIHDALVRRGLVEDGVDGPLLTERGYDVLSEAA